MSTIHERKQRLMSALLLRRCAILVREYLDSIVNAVTGYAVQAVWKIAAAIGYSERQVRRALRELDAAGEWLSEEQFGPNGRQRVNRFFKVAGMDEHEWKARKRMMALRSDVRAQERRRAEIARFMRDRRNFDRVLYQSVAAMMEAFGHADPVISRADMDSRGELSETFNREAEAPETAAMRLLRRLDYAKKRLRKLE
jgi:hypothetical protein